MKKYLVIGNPIEHSLSPKLHNFWIKDNNIDAIYEKKLIKKDEIGNLILEVKKKNIHGINVTVPFKKDIIPYLDHLSFESKNTQSVNTIYLKNDKIIGHNTDIEGFEQSIKSLKIQVENKKVFILGAGGVVPSIIFALNTFISFVIFLYGNNYEQYKILIQLNLIFGCFYLPWQFIHLRSISKRVAKNYASNSFVLDISMKLLVDGLNKSFYYREQTSKPDAWGGLVGLTWMLNYWATLIPVWLYFIIYI